MTTDVQRENAVRSQWSLSSTLAILMFALMAVVLSLFAWLADRVVHESAMDRADDRLGSIARELAANASRGGGAGALQRLAQDQRVLQALDVGSVGGTNEAHSARLDSLLRVRGTGERTFVGRDIWDASGTRRWGTTPLHARDSAMLASLIDRAVLSDSIRRSPIFEVNGEMHIWTVAPVFAPASSNGDSVLTVLPARSDEDLPRRPTAIGVLADLRRIAGSPETEAMLRRLTGADVSVYYTSVGSTEWSSLLGKPMEKPFDVPAADSVTHSVVDRGSERHYVVQNRIAGTPWLIVVSQSERSILARPREFRVNLVLAALLALAVGTVGAFWVSRRATRPLVSLRDAASDIAQGNYDRRVPVGGGKEVASLAQVLNGMALQIGSTTTEMAAKNAALQEANEAKTRFLAVMSHELRTPLNAINGYVELMNLGLFGPLTPEQQENLAKISRNSESLLNLVSDILHYSKLDAGQLTLRREVVSVQRQFDAAAETLGEQFAARNVALLIQPTNAHVYADPIRLQQVLLNLLTNAVRFTDGGGKVAVSATIDGQRTSIRVADTGVGIAADQLESIFRPFVQVDSSLTRRVGGTGLGLTIVRDLTEAMGGVVSATSVVGKGSEFTVVLDSAQQAEGAATTDFTVTSVSFASPDVVVG